MSTPNNLPPARPRARRIPPPQTIAEPSIAAHGDAEQPIARRDYEVGYGKPPKHSQFKAGQSGNPRGRPKGAKSLNALILEIMDEPVTLNTPTGRKRMKRSEVLLRKMMEKALKGDARAMDQVLRYYQAATLARAEQELAGGDALAAQIATETDEASLMLLRDMLLADLEGEGQHGTA